MRGEVTAAIRNVADRTVDMTVKVYTDDGTLIETDNIILPIDVLSKSLASARIIEHLNRVVATRAAFPYTDAQLSTLLVGMQAEVIE